MIDPVPILLGKPQCGITFAPGKQLSVRAAFDDTSLIHDQNLVRMDDRGQAMRNDQGCLLLRQIIKLQLDRLLCPGVQRRRRFVEDQHGGVFLAGHGQWRYAVFPRRTVSSRALPPRCRTPAGDY